MKTTALDRGQMFGRIIQEKDNKEVIKQGGL